MDDLLVDQFEVVAEVQKPEGVHIRDAFFLPFYDPQRFPLVLAIGAGNDFYVVNIKDMSMQTLIKANHRVEQGFCIKVGEKAFDFHFSSVQQEDDKKKYDFHYVLSFKDDVVTVMERTGQLPNLGLEENVAMIEEKKKTSAQLFTLTQEIK